MNVLRVVLFFLLACQAPLSAVDFVLVTQPKTGTHLLKPILAELTNRTPARVKQPEEFIATHAKNQDESIFFHMHSGHSAALEKYLAKKNCVVFFVKRDPRDTIVSLLNHYKNINFLDKEIEQIPDDDERLLRMIQRKIKLDTIGYMKWLRSPVCVALDFGKLMGSHGGVSSYREAIQELRKIADALELNVPDSFLEEVYNKHFGTGGSFFRGKVGSWKNYFKPQHKAEVKKEIGSLLIKLGYEKDYEW